VVLALGRGGGWQIPTSEKKSCGGVVQDGGKAQQRLTHPAKRRLTAKCANDDGRTTTIMEHQQCRSSLIRGTVCCRLLVERVLMGGLH
jgi:hypothetical protein